MGESREDYSLALINECKVHFKIFISREYLDYLNLIKKFNFFNLTPTQKDRD